MLGPCSGSQAAVVGEVDGCETGSADSNCAGVSQRRIFCITLDFGARTVRRIAAQPFCGASDGRRCADDEADRGAVGPVFSTSCFGLPKRAIEHHGDSGDDGSRWRVRIVADADECLDVGCGLGAGQGRHFGQRLRSATRIT